MLTDEQLGKLYVTYTYKTVTEALQEAYSLGLERAAEICDKRGCDCADAIRAAKGE